MMSQLWKINFKIKKYVCLIFRSTHTCKKVYVYDIGIVSTGSFAILNRKKDNLANFITTIDIKNATKDGIYSNGYVVNIPYNELKKLIGIKVLISGKVTIVKGLENNNDGIIRQGRRGDTKHILKPKIKA